VPVLLLIRHAQASYGAADYDVLSELGRRQSAKLDAALHRRGVRPEVAVTGPARRHRDTATLCEVTLGTRPVTEDERWREYETDAVLARHAASPVRLSEVGSGDVGLSSREFQLVLDAALGSWLGEGDADSSLQTWPAYLEQVEAAVYELADSLERGQTALVFTSAGAIAAACCALLDLPPDCFVALNRVQANTGITKVVRGAGGTSLVSFNEHSHLEETDEYLVTYR
jgi:broad specificity phosphatase PhoE